MFIALNIAKKYKKIATLCYIPSVIITPIVIGMYFIPAFLIVLILNVYIFIKFNPWKKDEMGSHCT